MSEVVAAIAPLGLLVGVVLGWNLRRVDSRCRHCGRALACPGCSRRTDPTHATWQEAQR